MARGRPKGSKNKRTLALEAFASASVTAPVCPQVPDADLTPLDYMLGVVRGTFAYDEAKLRAAVAAAPYCHPRLEKATQSKKDEAAADAKEAAVGKFATPAAPKLVVNNK